MLGVAALAPIAWRYRDDVLFAIYGVPPSAIYRGNPGRRGRFPGKGVRTVVKSRLTETPTSDQVLPHRPLGPLAQ